MDEVQPNVRVLQPPNVHLAQLTTPPQFALHARDLIGRMLEIRHVDTVCAARRARDDERIGQF
ncbi:hypothetical protein [Burkholderia cenocepacia]|uniref:hypothetical protein n=1 Tax=Burkholderia cenocepacia TaxID=95486 RepID=UPI001E319A7F|nr:hypothetical protein [Burkholderia cenocepacia]